MEDLKSVKISETEKNRLLIKNVNNRPNAMASFGKAKLTAEQTKDLFDKQFEMMVERHNGLCDETDAVLGKVEQRMAEQDETIIGFSKRVDRQDVAVAEFGERLDQQDKVIGDLDSALDEIHNYAVALIGGA